MSTPLAFGVGGSTWLTTIRGHPKASPDPVLKSIAEALDGQQHLGAWQARNLHAPGRRSPGGGMSRPYLASTSLFVRSWSPACRRTR